MKTHRLVGGRRRRRSAPGTVSDRRPPGSRPTATCAGGGLERARRLGHRPGTFVVQRLIYTEADKRLHAYKTYGKQKIPWDDESKFAVERAVRDRDPSLKKLYKRYTEPFNAYLQGAIGEEVSVLRIHDADGATALVKSLSGDKEAWLPVANALRAENRFWHAYPGVKHWGDGAVDMEWALLPKDYIPQAPDLPSAETSVRSAIPGATMGETYWEYVCVLIAIVKQEGVEAVKTKTDDEGVDSLDSAVQALHTYYKDKDVEYDDSSTRRSVMKEWGYSLVFTGPSSWSDLHKSLTLRKDETYIVDITGHTVKMKVKKNLPSAETEVDDPKEYYEFFSEADNYDRDETAQQVLYVFKK